ncbi:MAG: helix-turn-helix transcriptional regulator [Gemmatimonadetes bacterium]|nr:helix-turn-helix transcriptional regulator [Gemmatimonadota bacterium]
MISVMVVASTKVVSAALGSALAQCTKVLGCHTAPEAALAALRAVRADVLLLMPHFGKRVDVSLLGEVAALPSTPRVVVLYEEAIEYVLNATTGLPPHCRVSLSAPLGQVIEAVCHGRARTYETPGRTAARGMVILPSGARLSVRQAEVLKLHCQGRKAIEIAWILGISPRTVETHMRDVRRITGMSSNLELAIAFTAWCKSVAEPVDGVESREDGRLVRSCCGRNEMFCDYPRTVGTAGGEEPSHDVGE